MIGAAAVALAMTALMALILTTAKSPRWGPDPGLQQTACPKHWSRAGATCWKMQ